MTFPVSNNRISLLLSFFLAISFTQSSIAYNPPERLMVNCPTFEGQTERELRYYPDGSDFVIVNGKESFNRPLYGGNSALRVDAGDLPESSFYMPRHGGVVRFGIKTANGSKWLLNADSIISRYRPGSMIYEISDELLGSDKIRLTVIGLYQTEGLIAKAELIGDTPVQFVTSFGGIGGRKGKRSGDIGCESEPVSTFFQLKPQYCKDNQITISSPHSFDIESKFARFYGSLSSDSDISTADSNQWANLASLLDSCSPTVQLPVIVAQTKIAKSESVYFALQKSQELQGSLSDLFAASEADRSQIANKISVETPDQHINAAAKALCIAADAIWDGNIGSILHGAVAWRSKYLGWRGPYANDVLGWHDRAQTHLKFWSKRQNTSPVPEAILPADPTAHLARNEPSLHSNGDMSGKHYDMNLVYMDALFRHILWTGDLQLAQQLWPVIERHMAWERRLFRRTYNDNPLPLYEAYAAIWASDDMQYHGGGVAYTSAYNYYHNLMVARIAEKLGKDPSSFQQEADLILKGMRKHLWLNDRGWYGEWKDLLGLQSVHPAAGLWSFYHTVDSEAVSPLEAWQMTRYVDTNIAHIPVHGGNIPQGLYYTMPTSNWMPYTWSTNNVVTAEVAHTALAYWQAHRPAKAYSIFKGAILDNMYMGLCPGNAGMTTYFDMARGEAQRDFGDGVGSLSRALVEGLFGIKPDMLSNLLTIAPGFPLEWKHAKIDHSDIFFEYVAQGQNEKYIVESRFPAPQTLILRIPARQAQIKSITVNDSPAKWEIVDGAIGNCYIQITSPPAKKFAIDIAWQGDKLLKPAPVQIANNNQNMTFDFAPATVKSIIDPQNIFKDVKLQTNSLDAVIDTSDGYHTAFVQLQQGQMQWLQPIELNIAEPFAIIPAISQPADAISFQIQNNTSNGIDTTLDISVNNSKKSLALKIAPFSLSEIISIAKSDLALIPGSNQILVSFDENISFSGIVTNWNIASPQVVTSSEPVSLEPYFNDKITQIFQNEYLSPRSPYCSLAIPKQGIGSWCNFAKTFDVNDSGLRAIAKNNDGLFPLPQGIVFQLPTSPQSDNCIFTSQWDNYPESVTIDLSGKARHIYLLMAGSTNSMQSQFDNAEVVVNYKDGTSQRLALQNPTTWWPIDQDYFIDDYGFKRPQAIPPRVDLKTGKVRILDLNKFKGKGGEVPGGAATVLDLPLDNSRELKSFTVKTLANEVVVGLMSATLTR